MALAVWAGARDVPIIINLWVLIGLFGAASLAKIFRATRRASIMALGSGPILSTWLATRFILAPAFILVGLAWLVCWALGLPAEETLLKALLLLFVYGGALVFFTSALANGAAAIKGPTQNPPTEPPGGPNSRL